MGISAVVIAKNEEKQIRDCLDTLKWADEIIVLDDCSTDRTAEIAKSMGAKVYERKMDIEGKQRNYAYSLASHEWILSVDCDERVTEELAEEIKKLINPGPEENVFSVPIKTFIGKRWIRYAGYYPGRKDRLFRKGKFRYDENQGVHPRVYYEGKSGKLKNDILHYSYGSFSDFINKLNRETVLESQKWIEDGRKVSFLKISRKCIDRFIKAYFLKKGYKDGFLGFMFSFFHSLYQILSYAAYWERKNNVIAEEER